MDLSYPLPLWLPLGLVLSHFVGDWLLQSDWMALNKSKRLDALVTHVIVVTLSLVPLVAVAAAYRRHSITAPDYLLWYPWYFLGANFVLHFLIDFVTSRITTKLFYFELSGINGLWRPVEPSPRHWFFVVIGFDQVLHYVSLLVTASWWLI